MAAKERFLHSEPVHHEGRAVESDDGAGQLNSRLAYLDRMHHTMGNAAMGRAAVQYKLSSTGEVVGQPHRAAESPGASALPQSNGQALPLSTQQALESRAGTDLHDVQVFHGGQVDGALKSVGAEAATQGSNVYLGSSVDPSSSSGKETLIHELRHVAQNKRGETDGLHGSGGDPQKRAELERDADRRV